MYNKFKKIFLSCFRMCSCLIVCLSRKTHAIELIMKLKSSAEGNFSYNKLIVSFVCQLQRNLQWRSTLSKWRNSISKISSCVGHILNWWSNLNSEWKIWQTCSLLQFTWFFWSVPKKEEENNKFISGSLSVHTVILRLNL